MARYMGRIPNGSPWNIRVCNPSFGWKGCTFGLVRHGLECRFPVDGQVRTDRGEILELSFICSTLKY